MIAFGRNRLPIVITMLLLDGGSTSIRNFLPTPPPEIPPTLRKLWTAAYSQTCPSAVQNLHASFLAAGSDIITTNTYQIPLARDIPSADIAALTRSAVDVAVRSVAEYGRGSVALSFGTRNAIAGGGIRF
jgi:S-methylmethionine-dependent homocysteine/selenocysteine methylase